MIGQVKFFLSLSQPRSQICIKIYIFNLKKKEKNEKTSNSNQKAKEKAKETKEEKIIYVENLTESDCLVCKFAMGAFKLPDRVMNFFWLFI